MAKDPLDPAKTHFLFEIFVIPVAGRDINQTSWGSSDQFLMKDGVGSHITARAGCYNGGRPYCVFSGFVVRSVDIADW